MCVVLEKGRTAPLWIRENNCFYLPLNLKYNSGLPSVDVPEYSRNIIEVSICVSRNVASICISGNVYILNFSRFIEMS